LKAAVDRFHGIDELLCGTPKKAVLLVSAADSPVWVTDGIIATYETVLRYLQWEDCGRVLATGCYHLTDLLKTDYPARSYELGKNLR